MPTITGTNGDDTLIGGDLQDTLFGLAGNDILDGRGGDDTTDGGPGDDTHYVDTEYDLVIDRVGEGYDRLHVDYSYTLPSGAEIEEIIVRYGQEGLGNRVIGNGVSQTIRGGDSNNEFYGAGGNDTLIGNGGDDILDGGTGDDVMHGGIGNNTLFGGTGNDWYMIGSSSDTIVEKAGEGTADRVFASVSFALAADDDIEIMSTNFHAGTAAINLTGNALAQDIYGNEGNNILNGGGGDDWMYGRGGDDQFYVGSANDQVFERAGEGYDRVWASVSYTLAAGASIERLTTTNHFGTAAINLTGNELAQDIYGNDGNNIIRSGGGDDWLFGRSGDDQFYVDSPNALVFERAGEGFDRVWARSNYVLSAGSSIELLTTDNHFGTTAINLTGNELNQSIYGNDGSNVLVGGGGDDSMFGRSGDDVFIVDSLGDLAMERAGEGFDTVRTRGDYTLASGSSVERLLVDNGAGSSRAYLTGNELAQEIRGDNGDNVLDGKLGADSLFGGGGADLFLFTGQLGGGNVDAILDFASASDRIGLFQGTFSTLAKGALDPNAFRTGASAQDADDRIIYDPATGALWYDADGSGAGAAVQFASLQPGTALTASDFLVI